jgi:predicted ATPase
MAYQYSQLDKSNLEWFDKDTSKATLIRLEIRKGSLRGLSDIQIHFRYPITAFSGKNGTGKSTLLACVACGFHNQPSGYKPLSRRINYYTFSDFFIQAAEEIPPKGIFIAHQVLHDKWRKASHIPTGIGLAWQFRIKKPLGKWNNYDGRVKRNVVYLGIERVVPHAEKSVSKSYRHAFQKAKEEGYEKTVRETVGKIIGRPYDEFYFKKHSKYRLPLVKSRGQIYSGFNMGAGENALFEILSTIYACPDSLLIVIDELELGLHEEAQIRLIEELKKICKKRHIQIVCTTHSPRILSALPPEARIHLEKESGVVKVIPEISADYAAGLMSGVKQAELDILCEDDIAQDILSLALPNELRSRVRIVPIGSTAAVVRHLAARFKEDPKKPVCGFMDGDSGLKKQEHVNLFLKTLEKVADPNTATLWIENRLGFLPGDTWPEKWVLQKYGGKSFEKLTDELGVTEVALKEFVDVAMQADKHDELYQLSQKLNLPISTIVGRFIKCALEDSGAEVDAICKFIRAFL